VAHHVELRQDVLLDLSRLEQACLEADGVDELLLFDGDEGVVEETRLRPVVVEGRRERTNQVTRDGTALGREEAAAFGLRSLLGVTLV